MYIVFTAERVEDYWEKIPVVEYITKYKDNVDKYILSCYNDKEDYFAATSAGIETIIIDDNRIKYDDITIKKHCEFKDLKALLQNNYCNY